MEKHKGNLQEEYDLFMTNGDLIAIVKEKWGQIYLYKGKEGCSGMKILFDESVPVQPVNLVPKDKFSYRSWH